jgi:hypothetical protein
MRTVRIAATLIMGMVLLAAAGGCGGATPAALNAEDAALLSVLQADDTDTNPYVDGTYEDEHYARDVEDMLEGLDYNVTFLVALQWDGELTWQPLLKVTHAGGNVSIVDAQHDAIVTAAYDGDGDGAVGTLTNQTYEEIDDAFDSLIATGKGNDGQYLIFEFNDYEIVLLADKTVGKTLEELYRALQEDNTDKGRYVPHLHDCDDFARELEDALEAKGFRVTIKLIYWPNASSPTGVDGHAIVDVAVEDLKNGDVAIDPQTDGFPEKYDDDGDGVIGRYWKPSLIQHEIWFTLWKKGWKSGSDGKYWIEEYEDFNDIPYPLDPLRYELEADFPTLYSGGSTEITLNFSSAGIDLDGNINCEGGQLVPADDTGIHYIWYAENETGDPLEPGTYILSATFWDRWQRTVTSSLTLEVVADGGVDEGGGGQVPTCTGTGH